MKRGKGLAHAGQGMQEEIGECYRTIPHENKRMRQYLMKIQQGIVTERTLLRSSQIKLEIKLNCQRKHVIRQDSKK